jgi:O-antigen/teichoic acid export membrane protein
MKQNSDLMRFIKSSGIFFLGNILSKAISFFMLPIYTGYIAVEDMGYYDVSITYTNMVVSIVFFEVWSAVLRYMYDRESVEDKYCSAKSGGVIFVASAVVYVVVFIIAGSLMKITHWELIAVQGLVQCVVSFYTFSVRGLKRNTDFAISGILSVLMNASMNILLIVYLHQGFTSMYYSYIFGACVQIIYLEIRTHLLRGILKAAWDKAETKRMFLYALPLCVNTVAYWMMTGFNRLVINWKMGDAANGILAVGNRFGTLITLVTMCFTYAWQDLSFSKAKDESIRAKFYSTACNTYTRFLFCGMLLLVPLCHIAFDVMIKNPVYAESEATIPLFLLVGVLSAISSFIGNVFYAIKDTKTIFVSTVASALINAAIVFPAVSLWGLEGSNIAASIGFLCNMLIRTLILKKKIGFSYHYATLVILLGVFAVVFVVFQGITNTGAILLMLAMIAFAMVMFRMELGKLAARIIKR